MISLRIEDKKIIATYNTIRDSTRWVYDKFSNGEKYAFNKTFTFSQKDLWRSKGDKIEEDIEEIGEDEGLFDEPEPIDFVFAELYHDYYRVIKGVLTDRFDIYLHNTLEITTSLFLAESDISIFKKIESLINEDVYIGGEQKNAIPAEIFLGTIAEFPNYYEKKLYADAKIGSLIKGLFVSTKDAEKKFQNYTNHVVSRKGENLLKTFQEFEIVKYETIYDKLSEMLDNENNYSEYQWREEILQIALLLYPKYIYVFKEVPVRAYDIKEKFLDLLLVDSNGNTDIIEIKKPFENAIMTQGYYRDNYIPLRELTGTVMQIEKYIYYLNRWSQKGEEFLTEKYKNFLPPAFEIKITNPGGIIIMGRENNLSIHQKRDFEVVKRKYKNVMDIITYDNLLARLKLTIEQIRRI